MATQGSTDQAIANELGLSLATVGTYWSRIRGKLGSHSRTELVANYLMEESSEVVTGLREENQKLRAEVDRILREETELQSSTDLLRTLIDTAPDAILVVDAEGVVQLCSARASEMFGRAQKGLAGIHLRALVPKRFHGMHVRLRKQYMAHPEKRRMGEHNRTTALRADGTEFPIAASLSAFQTADGMLVTCIIRDLTQ